MTKFSRSQFEKEFNLVISKDDESFALFLETMRPQIYDFVLRMTGSQNKTSETCDEALKAVGQFRAQFKSPGELLVQILKTLKNFSLDAWAEDTTQLEPEIILDKKLAAENLAFEALLCSLSLAQREVIVLKFRFQMTDSEIKKFNPSLQDIPEVLHSIARKGNLTQDVLEQKSRELELFPAPPVADDITHDLSVMIGSVKKSGQSLDYSKLRIFVVVFLSFVAGCGVMYFLLRQP